MDKISEIPGFLRCPRFTSVNHPTTPPTETNSAPPSPMILDFTPINHTTTPIETISTSSPSPTIEGFTPINRPTTPPTTPLETQSTSTSPSPIIERFTPTNNPISETKPAANGRPILRIDTNFSDHIGSPRYQRSQASSPLSPLSSRTSSSVAPGIPHPLPPIIPGPHLCSPIGDYSPYNCIHCAYWFLSTSISNAYSRTYSSLDCLKYALYYKRHFHIPPAIFGDEDFDEIVNLSDWSVRELEECCLQLMEARDDEVRRLVEMFLAWWGKEGELVVGDVDKVFEMWDYLYEIRDRWDVQVIERAVREWDGWQRWVVCEGDTFE